MSEEKLVPKLRFEFSSNWESKKLKDIIQISKEKYNPNSEKTNYKCIELEHLAQETGLLLGYTDSINQNSIKNKFHEDNILFGKLRPYLKKFYYTNFEGVCSSEIWVFNIKEHSRYIYYLIQTKRFLDISNVSSGSKMPRSDWNFMKEFTFSIPDIKTQKETASLFSMIDDKIELLEKKYRVYQDFKRYLMQEIFAQKLRFDDNCQYKTKQVKDFLIESKIEGIDDINKRLTVKLNLKGITVRESKTIEIEGATKQFIRKTGQFIYGKQNLHKGAFGIIPKELDGYLTSSDIPSFDFKEGIEPKWFYYYFARKSFYEKLENLSTGTGSKRISPKEFLNIKIIVPEFKEQHKIVCLLEKFDEKINEISNQIVQMNMFKKSLLQQMFV